MTTRPLTVPLAQAALHNARPSPLRLAPPSALVPDRQYVEQPARKAPEVAAKKKKTRKTFDAAFKAKAVARALAAQESGSESVREVARDLEITDASIYQWIKAAKEANGAAKPADKGRKPRGGGGDIQTVSRELASAMEHVAKLKKKLRKMLGEA